MAVLANKHIHKKNYNGKRDFSKFVHVKIYTIKKSFPSIVNFGQVNAGWDYTKSARKKKTVTSSLEDSKTS